MDIAAARSDDVGGHLEHDRPRGWKVHNGGALEVTMTRGDGET